MDFKENWMDIYYAWIDLGYPEEWQSFANIMKTNREVRQAPGLFQEYCRELFEGNKE